MFDIGRADAFTLAEGSSAMAAIGEASAVSPGSKSTGCTRRVSRERSRPYLPPDIELVLPTRQRREQDGR